MKLFTRKHTIKTERIRIGADFTETYPGIEKLISKTADYVLLDKIQPIIVDRDYNLIDGYISYLIRTVLGEKKVRVIVVDTAKHVKGDKTDEG